MDFVYFRSTSPSPEHGSDNDTATTSSQGKYQNIFMDFTNIFYTANIFFIGMSSDNETVDVASSDETESDNDNEGEDDTKDDEIINTASDDDKPKVPSLSDILNLGHNNLDYLSEIYNTAFSKMPKVGLTSFSLMFDV